MANLKTTQLTAIVSLALTDLIEVVVDVATTPVNRKITIANFLVALGLRRGETDIATVTTAGTSIAFSSTWGTSKDDYHLIITCRNADNDSVIGYNIDNQDENGFDITPIADARVEYTVILKD